MDWEQIASEHRIVVDHVTGPLRASIEACADAMVQCLEQGGTILVCGNGGSAADAQHFAAELVNRFLVDSRPYAAIALTTDSSILTSVGNDYSFDEIFSKQVEALGRPGDMLVGLSTSGNSPDVVQAFAAAQGKGLTRVLLTGGTGGVLAGEAEHELSVSASGHTPRIQEGHLLIIHLLCEIIEETLHAQDGDHE